MLTGTNGVALCGGALGGLCLLVACEPRDKQAATTVASAPSASTLSGSLGPPVSDAPPRRGMAWIAGGALVAGSPENGFPRLADREMPGLQVILKGFYIDAFAYPNEEGAIPLTNVTQAEAETLCKQRDKRLCTELEWERACKGPDNKIHEYGDHYSADTCETGIEPRLSPSGLRVGCKSDFGVHDLHGGVWEWTSSPWGRGTEGDLVTIRGGNSTQGSVVGRCANGRPRGPDKQSGTIGFRCCAGERNTAEVTLNVVRKRALEAIERPERALMQRLVEVMPAEADQDLGNTQGFVPDRMWYWRPIGNEELLVVGGCVRKAGTQSCGVLVGRQTFERVRALAWASTGHWFPSLHPDKDPADLWLLGGDEVGRYKRLVAYTWGQLRVGEKERRLPRLSKRKSKSKKARR